MIRRLGNYLVNEGAKLIVLVLWLGINATLFYFTFAYYYYGPQFFYLHQILGYGLCISRATAACINLNACAILLPMCRGVLRILRGFPQIYRQFRRLLDKSKSFHITCGYMLCLMSAIHCGAHAFNAVNFCEHFNPKFLAVNVASFPHENPILVIVKSVPGVTGLLMVTCLLTILITASSPLRKANYRRFWKIHHLFIAFYVLLLIHACSGILKYQSNTKEHIPGCYVISTEVGNNVTVIFPEPESESEPRARNKAMPEPESFAEFHFKAPRTEKPEPESYYVVPEAEFHRPIPEHEHHKSMPEAEFHNPMPEAGSQQHYRPCDQPKPQFKSCPTEAWIWLSIPLFFYILERISRYIGSSGTPLEIVNVIEHPNDVIAVEFYQKNFKALPGQSIWLRCPQISFVESHPFTLTSIPTEHDPNFTIHMLALGEWTSRARDLFIGYCFRDLKYSERETSTLNSRTEEKYMVSEEEKQSNKSLCSPTTGNSRHCTLDISSQRENLSSLSENNSMANPSNFYAHGPYGSAMQDVFRYEISLCVAGGIGITPFAAILNMIL